MDEIVTNTFDVPENVRQSSNPENLNPWAK